LRVWGAHGGSGWRQMGGWVGEAPTLPNPTPNQPNPIQFKTNPIECPPDRDAAQAWMEWQYGWMVGRGTFNWPGFWDGAWGCAARGGMRGGDPRGGGLVLGFPGASNRIIRCWMVGPHPPCPRNPPAHVPGLTHHQHPPNPPPTPNPTTKTPCHPPTNTHPPAGRPRLLWRLPRIHAARPGVEPPRL
jgi:hypothetical protein